VAAIDGVTAARATGDGVDAGSGEPVADARLSPVAGESTADAVATTAAGAAAADASAGGAGGVAFGAACSAATGGGGGVPARRSAPPMAVEVL